MTEAEILSGSSARTSVQLKPAACRQLFPGAALIIAAVVSAALVPMLLWGLPSGHDFEFHVNSWMEVVHQWKQGIVYPRWASWAHYGFGEARFIFYPPASWLLGALLGLLLPWALVPAVYVWLILIAAGCSMFVLARRFLPQDDAVFASALYAVNPYHLVIVYWRSAFAELLASCLLPLLLLYVIRSEEEGRRAVVPLALIVAGGWLANAPAAVMINYSLALMLLALAIVRRKPRVLLYGAAAVALGAALAGFYVMPAAYEQKWVSIAEVLAPGVRPQDNFLFTNTSDADHNRFNLLVSVAAIAEIGISLLLGLAARRWRKRNPQLWWTLLTWTIAAAVLMLTPTVFLWQHLPKLRFVQLPWRWLLCLNVALAMFSVMGARRWRVRAAVCVVMLAVVVAVWLRVQPPWWDSAADVVEMHDNVEEGRGYEGTDEYVPAGADPYEVKQDAPEVVVQGGRSAPIQIDRWGPESKTFSIAVIQPSKLVLRLFNYPAWHVEVNGRPVRSLTQEVTGQMIIPVASGNSQVRVMFVRTWDRIFGVIVSLTAVVVTFALAIYFRRKEQA
jgi:6-pyruvoyl-tetrahydropterin synthase related domain